MNNDLRRCLYICTAILGASLMLSAWIHRPPRYMFLWPSNHAQGTRYDLYEGTVGLAKQEPGTRFHVIPPDKSEGR